MVLELSDLANVDLAARRRIAEIAERRDIGGLPELIRLMLHPDEEVAQLAVNALVNVFKFSIKPVAKCAVGEDVTDLESLASAIKRKVSEQNLKPKNIPDELWDEIIMAVAQYIHYSKRAKRDAQRTLTKGQDPSFAPRIVVREIGFSSQSAEELLGIASSAPPTLESLRWDRTQYEMEASRCICAIRELKERKESRAGAPLVKILATNQNLPGDYIDAVAEALVSFGNPIIHMLNAEAELLFNRSRNRQTGLRTTQNPALLLVLSSAAESNKAEDGKTLENLGRMLFCDDAEVQLASANALETIGVPAASQILSEAKKFPNPNSAGLLIAVSSLGKTFRRDGSVPENEKKGVAGEVDKILDKQCSNGIPDPEGAPFRAVLLDVIHGIRGEDGIRILFDSSLKNLKEGLVEKYEKSLRILTALFNPECKIEIKVEDARKAMDELGDARTNAQKRGEHAWAQRIGGVQELARNYLELGRTPKIEGVELMDARSSARLALATRMAPGQPAARALK